MGKTDKHIIGIVLGKHTLPSTTKLSLNKNMCRFYILIAHTGLYFTSYGKKGYRRRIVAYSTSTVST